MYSTKYCTYCENVLILTGMTLKKSYNKVGVFNSDFIGYRSKSAYEIVILHTNAYGRKQRKRLQYERKL
jgi:hypothetical protein